MCFSIWVFQKFTLSVFLHIPKSALTVRPITGWPLRDAVDNWEKIVILFLLVKAPRGPLTSVSECPSCVIGKWRTWHSQWHREGHWRIPVQTIKQLTCDDIMTLQYLPASNLWPHCVLLLCNLTHFLPINVHPCFEVSHWTQISPPASCTGGSRICQPDHNIL